MDNIFKLIFKAGVILITIAILNGCAEAGAGAAGAAGGYEFEKHHHKDHK